MFVHQRVICNVSRVRSPMGRPGCAAHLRPSERVCRLDSGLHACDQTKQGFKRASSEMKTGWGERDEMEGGDPGGYIVLEVLRGLGEGVGSNGRQQGSSSSPGS